MIIEGNAFANGQSLRVHLVEPQVLTVIATPDLDDGYHSPECSAELDVSHEEDRVGEEGVLTRAEPKFRVGSR
jgi:hypothetical protein